MRDKVYFASDFHLGVDARLTSVEREREIVRWLEEIADDAQRIYLVGDIFDYWFEYRQVLPRGFYRFIGKLIELREDAIDIQIFTGNHDMWMSGFFEDDIGIPVHRQPFDVTLQRRQLHIGHGDGLGPGDYGYKVLKRVLASPLNQWLYARLHPNLALWLMKRSSHTSRDVGRDYDRFLGHNRERLVMYCEDKIKERDYDYLVFGHRHLPLQVRLSNKTSKYIGLGDWLQYQSYGVLHDGSLHLHYYRMPDKTIVVS